MRAVRLALLFMSGPAGQPLLLGHSDSLFSVVLGNGGFYCDYNGAVRGCECLKFLKWLDPQLVASLVQVSLFIPVSQS